MSDVLSDASSGAAARLSSEPAGAVAESVLIDPVRLAACLGGAICRVNVEALAECASTNALLLSRGDSLRSQKNSANATSVAAGTVLVADRQTAGRGRRGRRWLSAQQRPEDSLTFSLLWRFPRGCELSGLSLAVGLALADAFDELGCGHGVRLKWPNDLLAETPAGLAKLGGILIELSSGSSGTAAVIGIGINLRAPVEAPPDQLAAGIDRLCDPLPERHQLLAALLRHLVTTLDDFSGQGFAPLRERWERRNAHAGRLVRLLDDSGQGIDGRCLGVDADGALRVETAAGVRRWLAGDVSLRPAGAD